MQDLGGTSKPVIDRATYLHPLGTLHIKGQMDKTRGLGSSPGSAVTRYAVLGKMASHSL